MRFSVAETIKHIVGEVLRIKDDNPVGPVTIISSNISMIHSLNRALLETSRPVLNVRIETFYQHVIRHAEAILLEEGHPSLTTDQAHMFIQEIIERLKLKYFKAAGEFPSYTYYFYRVIQDLRTGVPEDDIRKAVEAFGDKGKELYKVYREYLKAKKGLADYADMLQTYSGTDETLILFPGIVDELGLLEKNALKRNTNVIYADYQPPAPAPILKLKNPLYQTLEIKDVFREILQLGASLDQVAIIAPFDYLTPVIEGARQLNIPIFCPHGEEIYPDQIEVFKAALNVIDSDCDYQELKHFFQLRGHFAPIQALIDCGVAVGRDILKKAVDASYKESQKDRFKKLKETINDFERIEKLKKSPHKMGEAIVESFIPESHQKYIIKGILEDLANLVPDADYERWQNLVLERISRVRVKSEARQNSVFLTTDYLPGLFDYVFLVGIKEGTFPIRFREDAILLDHERDAINAKTDGTLKTAKAKNLRSTDHLNLTIACAEKGWFGYFPSMDLISGDEEFASFYLIDIVKDVKGKKAITREEYQESLGDVREPWMLESPDQCLDYFDWSIYHLMKGTKGFIGHITANQASSLKHFRSHRSYWSRRLDEYTGFINMDGRKGQSDRQYFSASELEKFMTCPYQWFIEHQLKIRPLEEPATLEKPDAQTVGSILHEVLENYMNEIKGGKHAPKKLDELLGKIIDEQVASTGEIASIYVEKLKNDISALTDNFLKHEGKYIKEGRKPMFFEFAFGTKYKKNMQDDPVTLKIGKHKFNLSGSIDRIDIRGKEAYVLDYKSSLAKNYNTVDFRQGQRLQPALYPEAFMALMGNKLGVEKIHAGYLPLKENSKEFLELHDKDRKDKLKRILDFIIDTMKMGYFFTTGNCDWCKCGNICGKGIVLASAYKMEGALKDNRVKALAREYKSFEEF